MKYIFTFPLRWVIAAIAVIAVARLIWTTRQGPPTPVTDQETIAELESNKVGAKEPENETYRVLPDRGLDNVFAQIDPFLAKAIRAIAAEYANEPVEWLEINHWPSSGRLIVFPSQQGPDGDRNERISCELGIDYLEHEFTRIGKAVPPNEQEHASAQLEQKLWGRVESCLRTGEAALALKEARKVHRFRVAAYDFDFGEGLLKMLDFDPDTRVELQKRLADWKRRHGVPR